MTVQDWIHRFPLLKDQFTIFKDWPDPAADTFNNASKQNIFTALAAMQDYHINYYRDYISWGSLDGFNLTLDGSASIEAWGATLYFSTHFVLNNRAYIWPVDHWYSLVAAGKRVICEWVIFRVLSVADVTRVFYLTQQDMAPPADVADHFGFKIINADIHASNADGTTQKTTDTGINLPTGTNVTRLRVVLNQGVDCKFYVNGVLKITHTVNLPDPGDYFLNVGLRTGVNDRKIMVIGRVLLEREY